MKHGEQGGYRAHGVLLTAALAAILAGIAVAAPFGSDVFDPDEAERSYLGDLAAARSFRGKVDYEVTFVNHFSDDTIFTDGEPPDRRYIVRWGIALYASGLPGVVRVDLRSPDEPFELTFIVDGEEALFCSADASLLVDDPPDTMMAVCLSDDDVEADVALSYILFASLISHYADTEAIPGGLPEGVVITSIGTTSRANLFARCYRATTTYPEQTIRLFPTQHPTQISAPLPTPPPLRTEDCVSDEGVALRIRNLGSFMKSPRTTETTYDFVAISLGEVTDEDFEPPYPVVDLE